jgi:hypothetical protein
LAQEVVAEAKKTDAAEDEEKAENEESKEGGDAV